MLSVAYQIADQVVEKKMFPQYIKYLIWKIWTTNTLVDSYGGLNKLVEMTNKSKQQKPSKVLIPSPTLH